VLKYEVVDLEDDEGEVEMGMKGVLEECVVKVLAENLQEACGGGGNATDTYARRFWELMKVKGVEARVMEGRPELCRMFPGGRIKIRD
jgi:hypothetical protein